MSHTTPLMSHTTPNLHPVPCSLFLDTVTNSWMFWVPARGATMVRSTSYIDVLMMWFDVMWCDVITDTCSSRVWLLLPHLTPPLSTVAAIWMVSCQLSGVCADAFTLDSDILLTYLLTLITTFTTSNSSSIYCSCATLDWQVFVPMHLRLIATN